MKSLRLQTIALLIEKNDKIADIGCDHAYLSIYLARNNLCQKVIATDINENALNIAKENIRKNNLEDKIKTYLSDGLQNVEDKEIDTVIISGMGSSTILHIIENMKNFSVKKFIIQSNNELPKLRSLLRKNKIFLQKEKVIYEKKHYYTIGVYTHNYSSLKLQEKWFGKYDASNIDYYLFLNQELDNIIERLKKTNKFYKKIHLHVKKIILKKYL